MCIRDRSYACSCGSPLASVSNVLPPSCVRFTTTRPLAGYRFSSFTAGTNQAVSESRGWTATANPNAEGWTLVISLHDPARSVDRKIPLWCCTHNVSGAAGHWTTRCASCAFGSYWSSGGMYSARIPLPPIHHDLPPSRVLHAPPVDLSLI